VWRQAEHGVEVEDHSQFHRQTLLTLFDSIAKVRDSSINEAGGKGRLLSPRNSVSTRRR
jgi:hypothetical protein